MSIGRDTGYNLAAAATPVILILVITPFYLHQIGPERFGVLAICWTLIVALGFTSLGMGQALAYSLPQLRGSTAASQSRMIWTALLLALGTSLIGSLLVLLLGRLYFFAIVQPAPGVQTEIRDALPVLASMLPVGVLTGVLNGALQGKKRFGALSGLSILSSALGLTAPLAAALVIGVHVNVLVSAVLCANLVMLAAQLILSIRLIRLKLSPRFSLHDAKQLLGYGGWMSATAFAAPLVLLLDRFVIGAVIGPAAVAIYVLPYNLAQQMNLIPNSLSSAVLPRLAAAQGEGAIQKAQSQLIRGLNAILSPMAIVAIACATPFFHLWIGPELGQQAAPVAAILLSGCWIQGIGHVPSTIVAARNRPDVLTKLLLSSVIPYAALLYFATDRFGIIGAAGAWAVRATTDFLLFLFTRPRRAEVRALGISAMLVLAAMVIAVGLDWRSPVYWVLLTVLAATSCLQNRIALAEWAGKLRKLALGVA